MDPMGRVVIPAAQVEFEDGGNTIWVTDPQGGTLLRVKTMGKITSRSCTPGSTSHCDIVTNDEIDFCLGQNAEDGNG